MSDGESTKRGAQPGQSATQDATQTPAGSEPVSESLSGPAYPLQPRDGERPVPLTAMPERPEVPEDWDVASTAPVRQRTEDEVLEERRAREHDYRSGTAEDGDDRRREVEQADVVAESGYATELEQGAAQPEPRR